MSNKYGDTMTVDGILTPLGYQQITALTAATALTVPAGARIAIIQPEAAGMRWRDDGVDPTATVGMVLALGDAPLTYNGNLAAIRLIQTATGGILNISYYG